MYLLVNIEHNKQTENIFLWFYFNNTHVQTLLKLFDRAIFRRFILSSCRHDPQKWLDSQRKDTEIEVEKLTVGNLRIRSLKFDDS